MFYNLHKLYHPDLYQGSNKTKSYFEGWYFKIVAKDGNHAFAVIPGVSMQGDGSKHAFIQILDGKNLKAHYEHFNYNEFSFSKKDFEINIGANHFTDKSVVLNTKYLKGTINFGQFKKWPSGLFYPGTMGWYSFMPFMECYHEVISMHHKLSGILIYNDVEIDFAGGNGYIEKDWGRSFPKSWVWTQCNNFEKHEGVSAMVSVADIPWVNKHFTGYLGAVQIGEEQYRFTTYNGSKMKLQITDTEVKMELSNKKYRMEVTAVQSPGADLYSPIKGTMTGKVNESLLATHQLEFYIKGNKILSAFGHSAGLEVAGPVEILMEGLK